MSARPTLCDVAERTGLSTATVSMALRDSPHLPEATRTRVKQAARDLGYRSDPLLAALAAHRWRRRPVPSGSTLAAIADGTLEGEKGMVERAAVYGYKLEVFQVHDYSDGHRLSDMLYNRGILGVVVGQIFTPGFCESFDWSRFVSVAASEGFHRPPVNLVMPNHFRAVQDGWDLAWARGYRRIGLALFDMPSAIDFHDRCAAFLDRQQRAPASQRIPVLAVNPGGDDSRLTNGRHSAPSKTSQLIDTWMRRHSPEVILAFNNSFYWLLRKAGWRVPEHAAFIDLWIMTSDRPPPWPGLILVPDEIGRRAIDWLDSLLRTGERGVPQNPATMLVDMRKHEGETRMNRPLPVKATTRKRR